MNAWSFCTKKIKVANYSNQFDLYFIFSIFLVDLYEYKVNAFPDEP